MVSVTALTAPLALLPFDGLEARDLGVLELAARERFEFEVARLRGRGLAAPDDALDERGLAAEDDRLAALARLPELAPRLLACVGRALDERALEATMGPSFWVGVQALYPRPALAFSALSDAGARAPPATALRSPASGARVVVLERLSGGAAGVGT
ncbi:MAG TPA: hypothetical protein VF080_00800 [Solirubrobacteraceae bacterium]